LIDIVKLSQAYHDKISNIIIIKYDKIYSKFGGKYNEKFSPCIII